MPCRWMGCSIMVSLTSTRRSRSPWRISIGSRHLGQLLAVEGPHVAFHVAGQVQLDVALRRARIVARRAAAQVRIDQHAVIHVGQAGARFGRAVALDLRHRDVADAMCIGVVRRDHWPRRGPLAAGFGAAQRRREPACAEWSGAAALRGRASHGPSPHDPLRPRRGRRDQHYRPAGAAPPWPACPCRRHGPCPCPPCCAAAVCAAPAPPRSCPRAAPACRGRSRCGPWTRRTPCRRGPRSA